MIRWGFAIGESEHGAARKSIKALAAAGSRFQMQCVLYNPVEKGDRQGNAASLFIWGCRAGLVSRCRLLVAPLCCNDFCLCWAWNFGIRTETSRPSSQMAFNFSANQVRNYLEHLATQFNVLGALWVAMKIWHVLCEIILHLFLFTEFSYNRTFQILGRIQFEILIFLRVESSTMYLYLPEHDFKLQKVVRYYSPVCTLCF